MEFVALLKWWDSQRALYRPAQLQPTTDCVCIDAAQSCPFGECMALTVQFKHSIRSAVVGLCMWRRPSTIPWRIWAIVIYTIQRMLRRALPHVFQKLFKAVSPSLADDDSSPTIVGISFVRMIVTARPDSEPRFILTGTLSTTRVPMTYSRHATKAATTTRCSLAASNQGTAPNDTVLSAIAYAVPGRFIAAIVGSAHHNQTTVALAS